MPYHLRQLGITYNTNKIHHLVPGLREEMQPPPVFVYKANGDNTLGQFLRIEEPTIFDPEFNNGKKGRRKSK